MTMIQRTRTPLLGAFAALVLAGCASSGGKFACPHPDGVSCMSSIEIYEATNVGFPAGSGRSSQERTPGNPANHRVGADGDSLRLAAPSSAPAANGAALSLAQSDHLDVSTRRTRGAEEAMRMPARVMRIYVSPWTDEAGDLHMPGYVFTEIVGRRWTIGVQAPNDRSSTFDPNGPWMPAGGP